MVFEHSLIDQLLTGSVNRLNPTSAAARVAAT